MGALDASVHAQRQLVADASHELRTPVTSLRTNIEILQQAPRHRTPPSASSCSATSSSRSRSSRCSINDLIDLARGEEPPADTEDVRLDLHRPRGRRARPPARPRDPARRRAAPTVLPGRPRAPRARRNNLIDNAVKYSPPGGPSRSGCAGGELTVRDHGPGIAAERPAPHLRPLLPRRRGARAAGSGLGLAIVRQVVEQHGGTVAAEAAPGGGTADARAAAQRRGLAGERASAPTQTPQPVRPRWTRAAAL